MQLRITQLQCDLGATLAIDGNTFSNKWERENSRLLEEHQFSKMHMNLTEMSEMPELFSKRKAIKTFFSPVKSGIYPFVNLTDYLHMYQGYSEISQTQ